MSQQITALQNKKIVLGITGSIAAYKAADLVRLLRKAGAEVRVVMTTAATEFITPLTLQTLSGQPVAIELLDADQESAMGHIKLARWADWVVIAPASANTIAGLVHGRTEDLLTALCLATEAPIAVAPAMNNKMWSNPATQHNLAKLVERQVHTLGPASGDQACGEQGEGRLLEPQDIVDSLAQLMVPTALTGKQLVITAGPTFEPIDPVRYIGNRSSGKMGFALATAAAEAGASVTLIAGPVHLTTPGGVQRIDVESAQEMYDAAIASSAQADIFIACAAVADYRPVDYQTSKRKKTQQNYQLELVETADIVSAVAQQLTRPFTVGFAAETNDLETYAKTKLTAKQLDMIAANHVGQGLGFAVDTNALHVFWPGGGTYLPEVPKSHLARDLMTLIIERYESKNDPTQNS